MNKKDGRSERLYLRVAPDWLARVRAAAEQRGITMSDFVILTMNERLGVVQEAGGEQKSSKKK